MNSKELLLGENGWLTRRLNYLKQRQKGIAAAELPAHDVSTESDSPPSNPDVDLEHLVDSFTNITPRYKQTKEKQNEITLKMFKS